MGIIISSLKTCFGKPLAEEKCISDESIVTYYNKDHNYGSNFCKERDNSTLKYVTYLEQNSEHSIESEKNIIGIDTTSPSSNDQEIEDGNNPAIDESDKNNLLIKS